MANYTLSLDPEDDVMTIREFREMVKSGMFIDDDGFGYPVKDGLADEEIMVSPNRMGSIPADATQVVWFNR